MDKEQRDRSFESLAIHLFLSVEKQLTFPFVSILAGMSLQYKIGFVQLMLRTLHNFLSSESNSCLHTPMSKPSANARGRSEAASSFRPRS
jgi:hypothetical protein